MISASTPRPLTSPSRAPSGRGTPIALEPGGGRGERDRDDDRDQDRQQERDQLAEQQPEQQQAGGEQHRAVRDVGESLPRSQRASTLPRRNDDGRLSAPALEFG